MEYVKRINAFLADSVSVINAVVVIGYPLVSALSAGLFLGNAVPGGFSFAAFLGGALMGGIGGLLFAGFFCGILAVLVDIRNSLTGPNGSPERMDDRDG